MSKAIFVLDEMPETCDGCPLRHERHDFINNGIIYFCPPSRRERLPDNCLSKRPSWCPLKEAPQRHDGSHLTREEFKNMPSDDMTLKFGADMMDIGWNSCLDTIAGSED